MEPIVLSEQELRDYTRKERPSAQARVLDFMGVPYRPRPDGSLAVLRVHVEPVGGARLRDPEPALMP